MPNRILREAIITSRAISALSDSGQIFYRCLMSIVDDYGRFEADPEILRARCFPRQLDRWPLSRVSEALLECGEALSSDGVPLVTLYMSDKEYLQINNFQQRIRLLKTGELTPSKYPDPDSAAVSGHSLADSGVQPPKTEALAKAKAKAKAHTEAGDLACVPPRFIDFVSPWTREANRDHTLRVWMSVIETVADEDLAFACRNRYLASDEVLRGVVMDPAKWLMDQKAAKWSGKWPVAKPNGPVVKEPPRLMFK